MNSKKSLQEKDCQRNSKCWYKDVCSQTCSVSCARFIEMEFLFENSGLPESKRFPVKLEATDDYEQYLRLNDIKADIVDFVKAGKNLLIASHNTGNGKTSWAIKLLMKYFDEIWAGNGLKVRGIYVHVPTLLLKLKNFQDPLSEEYRKNLINCDLVIWDDIACTELTMYDHSNMFALLDVRILNEKANIFTSNVVVKEEYEEALGSRIASRIWNTSEIIIFNGKDMRA